MKPAFSTVACPEWTLDQIADAGETIGALGVELRTFGPGSASFAGDPFLTSATKSRAIFAGAGVSVCCLATGVSFDEPIDPPVLGRVISDTERSVREGKAAVDLAEELQCPYVRVFGFEYHGRENRANANARIADRLGKVVDHCRNKGVRVVLENGGSFPTAAALAGLLDLIPSDLLGVAYSVPVAQAAGESVEHGLNVLGGRLWIAKLRDFRGGVPCALGEGDFDAAGSIAALARAGFGGWLVYEYDRAWLDRVIERSGPGPKAAAPVTLPGPMDVLTRSVKFMFERIGASHEMGRSSWRPRTMAAS